MKKIAIVTGASSGMGREAAYQISDSYFSLDEIWLIARRKERLEEVAKTLAMPSRILALDLTDKDSLEEFDKTLLNEKPDIKILVNAAGYGKIGDFDRINLTDETGMIELNCEALTHITYSSLRYMGKNSRIIMFSSAAAFLPEPQFSVYAATKSFVLSLGRALGAELKPRDITVTSVCPGPVRTEFFDVAEDGTQLSPFKRLFMADPRRVVKKALRDSAKGKSISVYSLSMKLAGIGCRILPQNALIKLMQGVYNKGNGK